MKDLKKKSNHSLYPKADIEVNSAVRRWQAGEGDRVISGLIEIDPKFTEQFKADVGTGERVNIYLRAEGFYVFLMPNSKIAELLASDPTYLVYISMKKKSQTR